MNHNYADLILSIVVPTEELGVDLKDSLDSAKKISGLEVIIVGLDEADSRAERLNIGFVRSRGRIVLFHHPRSLIDLKGIQSLFELGKAENLVPFWGGFTHQFDARHFLLQFTSWYSNRIRARFGVIYLDHGIFFHRSLWENELPIVKIFEDTILSYQLRKICAPVILPFVSKTSAVRFIKNGVFKQALLNQFMKIGFYLNVPDDVLNWMYERGLDLNSKFNKHGKWGG